MIDFLIKAVIFILIFSTIIIVHEGGHFILAKKNGIAVREFTLGMGPRIAGIEYDGTLFSINLLPFGGACVFEGMFPEDEDEEEEDEEEPEREDDISDRVITGRKFGEADVWGRLATVLAGPVFNFILAFFLSLFVIGSIGYDPPCIAGTVEGYPAYEAGLRAGDMIKSLNGRKIVVYRDISAYTLFYRDKKTIVEYERDGKLYKTVMTPLYDSEYDRYLFGIMGSVGRIKANPLQVIRYSLHEVYYWIDVTYKSLCMIPQGRVTKDDVAGPVGMAQAVGETYDESKADGVFYIWLNMVNLTILISANLGVMNLLPIPALDGGRIVFLLIEIIRKKPVDPEKEQMVHFAGIMVLMVFMVWVMYNDITRFFR